jgi:transcriptional regulator with XRE-family HTH domain
VDADEIVRMARCRELTANGRAREIRERSRLSLAEMAAACGVDEGTLSRWERGQRRPRSLVALRYLALLDALDRDAGHAQATA